MGILTFYKYQATGNDFIMIDNRENVFFLKHEKEIVRLCDRRYGIGADGLILINNHPNADFDLIYYNADGSLSLCGNGSRCAVSFAKQLGIIQGDHTTFNAFDGVHEGWINGKSIRIKLNDIQNVRQTDYGMFIDTGSPHLVQFVDDLAGYDVVTKGRELRNCNVNGREGTNVNFVEVSSQGIKVRTYERGVENETLSCGTGVTACALAAVSKGFESPVEIETKGGTLVVEFQNINNTFKNIFLSGPAEMVFKGQIE